MVLLLLLWWPIVQCGCDICRSKFRYRRAELTNGFPLGPECGRLPQRAQPRPIPSPAGSSASCRTPPASSPAHQPSLCLLPATLVWDTPPLVQMVLTRSARGLIRGSPVESVASAANEGPGGRIAALLCFDELQITDTFTAVALKGARRGACLHRPRPQVWAQGTDLHRGSRCV